MRLTPTGLGVLCGGLACAVVGIALGSAPLVGLGCGGLAATVAAAVTVAEPPGVELVRRPEPAEVDRGARAEVVLELRGLRGRRARPFAVIETVDGERRRASLPAVVAGRTLRLAYGVDTSRRGVVVAGPLVVRRSDPFGLVVADRGLGGTCTVSVRPRRHRLHSLPSGRRRDLEGPTRERSRGTTSFHQLRSYVPGDDMRHIHWRTTARTGEPMVRELADTTRPEILVVLDNRRAVTDEEDFEEAVEVAASLVDAGTRDGFPVLLQFTSPVDHLRCDATANDLLERLTAVCLGDDDSLAELAHARHGRGRSLVLVTGELAADDLALVGHMARSFSSAHVVSVVAERSAPFIAPRGTRAIACGRSSEFPEHWRQA